MKILGRYLGIVLLIFSLECTECFCKTDPIFDSLHTEYRVLKKQLQERRFDDPIYQQAQDRLQKEALRKDSLLLASDSDPVDVILRRTKSLVESLSQMDHAPDLIEDIEQLERLRKEGLDILSDQEDRRIALFTRIGLLRRKIAFSNPLLDFNRILFLKHHKSRYNHMVDQYYGFHAIPGGSVFVLDHPFGDHPTLFNLLQNAKVENGRLKDRLLDTGSFISLELSYDAQEILFAWTEADPVVKEWTDYVPHDVLWTPQSTYHVFKAKIDGSQLTQLTDGTWNDFDPVFLPNGRIAFISERRGGYLRCGLRPDPTYTLYNMKADGSDIQPLSYHETHEWHPSVDNNGMIVYTRWDYVDRDSDIAHHLWLTFPDGRDPRSYHGNYPEQRELRPWMEMSIRAIPNSHKYVAVSAPHHGQAYGSLVLIDQRPGDDRSTSQLRRITPDAHFPESESAPGVPHPAHAGKHKPYGEIYGTPWPLSEDYYLCVYDPDGVNYGIYLIDSFGNRDLLYRDPDIACLDPMPLHPRIQPPVIPSTIDHSPQSQELAANEKGLVAVMNVYDSDFDWPKGARITDLRIIQIFPKTTPAQSEPNIGIGAQSLARGVLGTVPVEADGSAYFEAPAGIPFYFQALDEQGLAVQTMRSDTYLHPGETLSCRGCHESKQQVEPFRRTKSPMALQRPPSKIKADIEGSYPLLFSRLVQPVLDRHCAGCHESNPQSVSLSGTTFGEWGWSTSYTALAAYAWAKHGGNGALGKNETSRSIAGNVGARASQLFKMLQNGHGKLNLSTDDLHRITLWMDCNSTFYGAYHDLERQAQGQIVMPDLF